MLDIVDEGGMGYKKEKGKKAGVGVAPRSRRKRDGTGNDRWLQREMEHEAALERGHRLAAWWRPRDKHA